MLKRIYRLPSQEKFLRDSQIIHTPFFSLRGKRQEFSYSRFGVVIPKKVDKRAVVRNRTRRILMQVILENKLFEKKGYDMLFIIKKPFEGKTQEATPLILQAVDKLLTRL